MGLKIQTKINDFDYPEEEAIILLYGEHEVDVRPYILSFFLRSVMGLDPIEIEYFTSRILEMLDGYLQERNVPLPTLSEMTDFRAKCTSQLVKKVCELHNSKTYLA